MSTYDIVLVIFTCFLLVFCVLLFISISLTNKQVERIAQKVIKLGTRWVYFVFDDRFEVGYFTNRDTWICIHKVDTEDKAMALVNYLNGGKNDDNGT